MKHMHGEDPEGDGNRNVSPVVCCFAVLAVFYFTMFVPRPLMCDTWICTIAECFVIDVMGKNGVVLNGTLLEAGKTSVPLKSQSLLQIGADVTFYFLLPKRLSLVFNEPGQKRERYVLLFFDLVDD